VGEVWRHQNLNMRHMCYLELLLCYNLQFYRQETIK
jgi:hypothetical protein